MPRNFRVEEVQQQQFIDKQLNLSELRKVIDYPQSIITKQDQFDLR